MIITLYNLCCGKGIGIEEYHQLLDLLRKRGLDPFIHLTRKNGNIGRKDLTIEQINDNKIYIKTEDNRIWEITNWIQYLNQTV